MKVENVAAITHEVNRVYCESLGDFSQKPWSEAPDWQKKSAVSGVTFAIKDTSVSPADLHANWLKDKEADGWRYGPVKDVEKKEHLCFVPYEELPENQRIKDHLFRSVVLACLENEGIDGVARNV